MKIVVGVDLGGTAINYTFLNENEKFLIEGLCEHPARSTPATIFIFDALDFQKIACRTF